MDASLTPYVSLIGLRLQQAAFTERGSAMGLAAPAQTHDATLAELGLRFGRRITWTLGRTDVGGYVAWRRVLSGADLGMTASFAGVPQAAFTAQGQNLPRNVGRIGLRLATAVNAHWGWFVDADWQTGSEGMHQAAADAGIRITL